MLKEKTYNLYVQMERAVTLQNNGNIVRAREIYHSILKQFPRQVNALHNLALIDYNNGEIDSAITKLLKCVQYDDAYFLAQHCLAEIYEKQGNYTKAIKFYTNAYAQELKLQRTKSDVPNILKSIVQNILCENAGTFELSTLKRFSYVLSNSGIFNSNIAPLITYTKNNFKISQYSEKSAIFICIRILVLLGQTKHSSKEWNNYLFVNLSLPLMKQAVDEGYFDLLLKLENYLYSNYTKQIETESHFHYCFNQWLPFMEEAGTKLQAMLPTIDYSPNRIKKPKLAFFFHNTSALAHTQVVLNFIKGINELEDTPFRIKIYFFTGDHQPTIQQFLQLGVEVTILSQLLTIENDSFVNRLIILRNMIREEDVHALAWITLPTMMCFAFSLRIAPIQIWWGMKYHNLKMEKIDAYLGLGAFEKFRQMYGNFWRIGHTVYSTHYVKPGVALIESEKMKYKHFDVILGCLAREEKMDNDDFLSTVVGILKQNNNVGFLWTGSRELESVKQYFTKANVIQQCVFVGWVDTKLYAEVIDIFIDSFPFPCATSIVDSMLCAKPVVMMNTKESKEIGVPMLLRPILEGSAASMKQQSEVKNLFKLNNENTDNVLLQIANNSDEYQLLVQKLIDNFDYRIESGLAYQKFTQKYLQDINLMANSYSDHFLEIIDEHNNEKVIA